MLPEMIELRKTKSGSPQLIILGAEIYKGRIQAFGFISFEPLRKGRRFNFEGFRVELTEKLPGKTAAIYPVNMNRPLELEIIKWP